MCLSILCFEELNCVIRNNCPALCCRYIWSSLDQIRWVADSEFFILFIATNICLESFQSQTDKVREAFYRQNLPNVTKLLATVLISLIVIYFERFRVVLLVRLTGFMPIIFAVYTYLQPVLHFSGNTVVIIL
ncbi:hypothetical protein LWI29_010397 [Acer saccharum]|uniref:Uncharacterized protein n=1 Tax=Acer saccharum TaxID=4024 RepID=A0AA39SMZ9_ACESA|nr:hypothetical protein LWI29_010397 [Acer saccharum]